jgi:hypothetical protein
MFDKYKKRKQNKFNKSMNEWYENRKGDGSMEYNPMLSHINFGENQLQHYVDSLNENFTWSKSDPASLFKLYSKYRVDTSMPRRSTGKRGIDRLVESNYWYAKLFIDNEEGVENAVRYSTGVASKIPSTMATLCLGNGYTYNLEIEDKEIEDESETFENLEYILNENNLNTLLFKAFRTQSWAGGFAFKWSIHSMFDTPVLEVVSPMNYRYEAVAGRIVEDIFIKYYYKEDKTYKLEESYGVDQDGAYITFKLYTGSIVKGENCEWKEVTLDELTETKELKDIHIKGYMNRLSIYVPNKSINSMFPDSLYGESDYTSSYGALNFLDESYSTYAQELRDARLLKYMPDTMGEFDADNMESSYPSFLRSTHLIYKGSIGQDADDKIEYRQAELDTLKSEQAIKQNYMIVLNNAGLSPLTFGLTGLEAIDATAESQQEREKVSIRTRNTKNAIQEPAISKMLAVGYDLYQIMQMIQTTNGDAYTVNIKPSTVIFRFNDYIIKSKRDKTDEATIGVAGKTWDIKKAVDYVHEDMTDDERIEMRINIKIENGINVFTKEEELHYKTMVQEIVEETPDLVENEDGLDTEENEVEPQDEDKEEVIEE